MHDKDLVSPLGDKLLSLLLALCELIGMVGNALALLFFCSTQRKDMAGQLYIVICVVDIFTSIAAIPVNMSLWQSREPLLFNIGQVIEYGSDCAFCYSWVSEDKFTGFSKIMIVLDNVLTNIEVGIPSLVTFVAFMVCVV